MEMTLLNRHLYALKFPANAEEAFLYMREMVLNGIITNRNWLIKSYIYFENMATSESMLLPAGEAKLLKVLAHHLSLPEAVPSNCTKVLLALFEPFEWTDMRLRLVNGLVKAAVNNEVATLLNALAMLMQNYNESIVCVNIAKTFRNEFIFWHSEVCKEMQRLPIISLDFCITILAVLANIYFCKALALVEPPVQLFDLIENWFQTQPTLCKRLPSASEGKQCMTPFRALMGLSVLGPLTTTSSSFERYQKLHEILLKSIRATKQYGLPCSFTFGQFTEALNFLKSRTDHIKANARLTNLKLTVEDYYKYQKCFAFIKHTAMEVQNLKCTISGDQQRMLNRLQQLEKHYADFSEFERLYL